MDFQLDETQKILLDTIRDFGKREKLTELAATIDRTGEFPHHLLPKYGELGLLGMGLSPELGGGGQSALTIVLCIAELAKFSPMIAAPVFESGVGPVRVIDAFGTQEQKQTVVPAVCRGESSVSVCMTEPGAGSDLTSLSTKLVPDGDGYRLNGTKTFISGAGVASHYLIYCRYGDTRGYKGIGAILLDKGREGFSFGRQEEFMGLNGMPSCDLIFEDVPVREEDIVLREGEFRNLMTTFDMERCGNAAMCLGVAEAAVDFAKNYAMERKAFGRPLCEFQAVQNAVVEMATKVDAAKLLVYRAAQGAGRGFPSMYESAMAKNFANQMAPEVTSAAMEVLGGYGYSKEFPVERMHRDALAWRVAGGTAQMLRLAMASLLFGRRFDQRPGK